LILPFTFLLLTFALAWHPVDAARTRYKTGFKRGQKMPKSNPIKPDLFGFAGDENAFDV
jgi:hypothetical protein